MLGMNKSAVSLVEITVEPSIVNTVASWLQPTGCHGHFLGPCKMPIIFS